MNIRSDRYKNALSSSEIADVLLKLFVNRMDTYAIQREDGTYIRLDKPVTKDVLRRHLTWEITVGTYQLNKDNAVKELVFDVDPDHVEDPTGTTRSILEECIRKPSPGKPRFWPSTVLLEASRYPDPSYHVRVLFQPEVKAGFARWLGLKLLDCAGLSPSQVEVFPKQTSLTVDRAYGNFVKLPLGYHRAEGKWSCFLDHKTFKPLPDRVLLDAYGVSFSESDLKTLENHLGKERGVQMGLLVKPLSNGFRDIEDREEKETADLLAKYWMRGYRNSLEMAFLGWCLKNGVSYESAHRIIDAVTSLTGDDERSSRLQLVKYHYRKRRSLGSKLKGITGLVEVIREVTHK